MRNLVPVLTVVAVIIGIWFAACIPMNIHGTVNLARQHGFEAQPEGRRARLQTGAFQLAVLNPDAIPFVWA